MKKQYLLYALLFIFGAFSCVNDPADEVSLTPVVVTHKSETANFKTYGSFYLPTEIVYFDGSYSDRTLPDQLAVPFLAEIQSNLEARGYSPAASADEADLVFQVMAINQQYDVIVDYYWDWYWDWYGYWGPWYPYYPWGYVYSYNVGSLIINAVDNTVPASATSKPPVIWNANIFGALDSYYNVGPYGTAGIDQAFAQSPYFTNH